MTGLSGLYGPSNTPASRIGLASTATNPSVSGAAPAYGLAYDVASADFDGQQFADFVRTSAELNKKAAAEAAAMQANKKLHDMALDKAKRYQESGVDAAKDDSWFNKAVDFGKQVLLAAGDPGGEGVGENVDIEKQFSDYTKQGGLLTKDEFASFDPTTRAHLMLKSDIGHDVQKAMSVPVAPVGPGGSLSLGEAIGYGYKGVTTPFLVIGDASAGTKLPPGLAQSVGVTGLFSPKRWQQAWNEADDRSLGNAIVDMGLRPYVSEDTLDDWRKHNSLYQATSFGSEFLVGYYADPAVLATKGASSAARVALNKMPLKQDSAIYKAMAQTRQGEQVTTKNPFVKGVADYRARRMMNSEAGVDSYLKTVSYGEASQLKMADSVGGQPLMYALHWANNRTTGGALDDFLASEHVAKAVEGVAKHHEFVAPQELDLTKLTWRMAAGDPKAFAIVSKLKGMTPKELQEFAPGAQTFIDAVDATKIRATQLEQEVADLAKSGETGSRFHRWEMDTEASLKQAQVARANDALQGYEGYGSWLDLMGTSAGDKAIGHFDQIRAPKPKGQSWNGVEPSRNAAGRIKQRFFMDNQFGVAHTVREMPRAMWIQKANTVTMHDLDSGVMSLNRQAEQFKHLFGYEDTDALNGALQKWLTAETNYDRYKVMHEFEDTHLIRAGASRFGVPEDLIRGIFNKINDERNKSIQGVLSGDGSIFSSAPALADRVAGSADQGVKLVSRNDNGTVTLELMDNGKRVTTTVPDAALELRVKPIDPTQTPNYYTPINHYQFFHELKRHEELLNELGKGSMARTAAGAAELGNTIGENFNKFWKPVQLWRLGWPQRVLMDEGLRAAAIFGPMYWITGPGGDAGRALFSHDLPAWVSKRAAARRVKKGDLFGPGPMQRESVREMDPFARDREVRAAVKVPEVMWPKINPARAEKINGHVDAYSSWKRTADKQAAWNTEFQKIMSEGHDLPVEEHADKLRAFNEKLSRHGLTASDLNGYYPAFPHEHPADVIAGRIMSGDRGFGAKRTVLYDPTSGARINKGYVVPFHGSTPLPANGSAEFFSWYERNAEMLSREGMRVVVTPDGQMHVGKWFASTKRNQAEAFLQYAHKANPEGARMWNLEKPEQPTYIKDVNKPSPFMESAQRQFGSSPEIARTQGKAPIEGEPEVFHGTTEDLPENLLTRDEVAAYNGNMIGKGLYTTMSQRVAETYGSTKLYTIRGSKSGRTYKVFDLDQPITEDQIQKLDAFARARFGRSDDDVNAVEAMLDELRSSRTHGMTMRHPSGQVTWANVYESLANGDPFAHKILHAFLEEKHGAGALTHRGGTTRAAGNSHQVYVWMHPEDLEVRPLYDKTGRYYPVEQWLSHPSSLENAVPESRVVRTGVRNPMYRRLAQIGHKVEALKAKKGDLYWGDDMDALVSQEQDLMRGLGLEYRSGRAGRDALPTTPLLSDRYVVTDENRFNRTFEDAVREDSARELGKAANGNLRYVQMLEEERIASAFDEFDQSIDSLKSWAMRKITRQREFGGGWTTMRAADGKSFTVPNVFEGHQGQLTRGLTSSNKTIDVLSEGHGGALSLLRRQAQGMKTYHAPQFSDAVFKQGTKEHKQAVEYFQRWADMVNDQVGNSPIWSKMLKGWSDEGVTRWLEETPEGAAVRREVMPEAQTPALWVNEHRSKLNYYLPSPKLQRLLSKGRIQPSDLRRNIHESEMPDIFGPDLEVLDKGSRYGRALNNVAEKIWTGLGTVPIDKLSRHPFAKANYDMKMRSLIGSTDSKWLDANTLERFQRESHDFAMRQVRKTLWDLTDETNFTEALRFIAPFWGAQQEAITKWIRIVAARPETVARFFVGQRAAYNNFAVVDKDGQPVDTAHRKGGYLGLYQPEDRVILPLPKAMQKGPLGTIGAVGIPIGSANTVLQGELPLFPGFGPLVTIPADKFLRTFSDTYGTTDDQSLAYRWLFPIGRPSGGVKGILEQLSPGWGKRLMSATAGENDVAHANLFFQTYREMALKNQREGKKPPTPEEVQKQTRWAWALRTVAGMTMPVQTEFRPKNQYFLDQYHAYQQKYGAQAMDKFMDDYGEEMVNYAVSSSNSVVDIPPTDQGMEDWASNKKLIAKYPTWGSAIVSPDAYSDDFNYDAYKAQFDITLGPGDSRTLRKLSSPQERANVAGERVGWREFRKFSSALDAELSARGLQSIQQNGAEDLVQLKRAFVADMSAKYPAWREAYDTQANDIYSRVHELSQFAFNKEFDKRPDMQGVREYLAIRDQVTTALDAYGAQGGSRSLQAGENAAIRQWFYGQVGTLIEANPAFGEFYSRWLDGDTLEQGGGGF